MKAPIKKKSFTRPSIDSIRESLGLNMSSTHTVVSSASKPQSFIAMPEAFVEATKLPGIPEGTTTLIFGHSNTGKSLLKNCLIASAQRQGILPVIYETENNFSFPFAMSCGMQAEPVYGEVEVEDVDEETGEVTYKKETQIINYTGSFLYYDSAILADRYGDIDHSQGKKVTKKRTQPVIEDIAYSMNEILDAQEDGRIQQPILFIWDSIGSIPSYRSMTSKTSNAMWDAGALSQCFNMLLNNRIPSSQKISSPYLNTFVAVNKIWVDSMSSPMAAPSMQLKGGNSLNYAARLTIQLGGTIRAATKKLQAETKGVKYTYGLTTKIKVIKNQLDSPYNVTYEGSFNCVPDGMIPESRLADYKKQNISKIIKQLSDQLAERGEQMDINESDVAFSEEETDD